MFLTQTNTVEENVQIDELGNPTRSTSVVPSYDLLRDKQLTEELVRKYGDILESYVLGERPICIGVVINGLCIWASHFCGNSVEAGYFSSPKEAKAYAENYFSS